MNAQFFSMKRAHHGVLRLGRNPLAQYNLTAARFDMLYAIHRRGIRLQSRLRRVLGVSASVVSRMLASLEKLHLVARERSSEDRRQQRVWLTPAGECCLRHAQRKIARPHRPLYRTLMHAITFGHANNDERCFRATCDLDSLLRSIRRDFKDSATLFFPWHPDD